jgi:hypothetical protein
MWRQTTLARLNKDEKFLENVLAGSPELLGLESRRTGIRGPFKVLQQINLQTPSGRSIRPDLTLLTASGHVVVVEVKRYGSQDLSDRSVIAQIIDYVSSLTALDQNELLNVFQGIATEAASWPELVRASFPDEPDGDELAGVLWNRISNGEINLVIACDRVPAELPDIVGGIASQSTLGFDLDVVEVTPFVREDSDMSDIAFVPTPRLATEIVSRTAVTVTYREGDQQPSTSVQTTSVREVEELIVGRKKRRMGPRPERLKYWVSFCKFLEKHDVKSSRPTEGASLDVPFGSTGARVLVFMYGDPTDRIGVRFKSSQGVVQALREQVPSIERSLGAGIYKPGKRGELMIQDERSVDISDKESWPEQHQWLLDTIRQFDKTLSPHISTKQ